MASIGVGITTYNRPEMLKKCLEHIKKHTFNDNVTIYVADDSNERKGVAYRKNECLRALKDCDYVFLFDDDCYPIKDGWVEFFIQGIKPSGYTHFLFMNDKFHRKQGRYNNRDVYNDCGGVFMFLTKKDIEKAGAFNEEFGLWGFEHADYSRRISPSCPYQMLVGTEDYLYAEDYSNPNHKSSITNEEKNLHFKKNFPKFATKVYQTYIPL